MALDELHARRLATVGKVFEAALDRMELVVRSTESPGQEAGSLSLKPQQAGRIRKKIEAIRKRLHGALRQFSVRVQNPEPRQMLAAELSVLWVVLENNRPQRMTGYGRDFAPEDEARWVSMVDELLQEVEQLRRLVLEGQPAGTISNGEEVTGGKS